MNDGLTSSSNLNQDEFDTIFELVIALAFMFFGVLAIIHMNSNLLARTEVITMQDKSVVIRNADNAAVYSPFRMSPYQAYMTAWHMDGHAYESLSYVGSNITGDSYLDGEDSIHVTIDPSDNSKFLNRSFVTYRNQSITGKNGVESDLNLSVRKSMGYNAGQDSDTENLYWRKANSWELNLTDKYVLYNDLGNPYTVLNGGKTFKWTFEPTQ